MTNLDIILKNSDIICQQRPFSQSYGFSSSYVWMWELDYKESWAPKNWCFWIVVLEKTLQSRLDSKEIQPVHPKGNQSWYSSERLMLKLRLQHFGNLMQRAIRKDPDAGKDWRQVEKETTEDKIAGWHHKLNGHEFEQAPGDGEGQGSPACCSPWGFKELDMTERLNKKTISHSGIESCGNSGFKFLN